MQYIEIMVVLSPASVLVEQSTFAEIELEKKYILTWKLASTTSKSVEQAQQC